MKKMLPVFIIISLLFCSCSGKDVLENTDADAKISIEDSRNISATSPLTGRKKLESVTFTVGDPDNSRLLPTEKREHSYGVAKDGKPHSISADAQSFFASKNYKAVCYDTKSAEKVLYLTFDCGWENGYTDKILDVLSQKKVPAAFFCTLEHIRSSPELTARMINEGHTVGNHSATHPDFSLISRQRMAEEILECENYLRENFGYSSCFFRFPEGSYTENALELVGSMGYTSVFWSCAYADWDISELKGADYAFDKVTSRLHPGAIILLHSVSPDNAQALGRIIDYARENGYEFRALSDYRI